MRRVRSVLVTLAAAGALTVTAACGGTTVGTGSAADGGQVRTDSPPTPARSAPGPAPAPGSTAPTRPALPVPPGPPEDASALPRCTTGVLTASLGEPEGAAGSVYRALVFTNTGPTPCGLRGFPGVSYVAGEDGHQVGPAADMSGERGGRVPLTPGATARAQLQQVDVRNFDPATCAPTPVRGLRIYPPGDTASLFVPADGTACATTPPGPQLRVETITP
jgi:hypothetical protein